MKRKQDQRAPSFIQFSNKKSKTTKLERKGNSIKAVDRSTKKENTNNPAKIWIVINTLDNLLCLCIYYGSQNERNWVNCYVLKSYCLELEHYYFVGALHILENDDIPNNIIIYSDCEVLYLENSLPSESNRTLYDKIQKLVKKRPWPIIFLPIDYGKQDSQKARLIAQKALESKQKQSQQTAKSLNVHLLKSDSNYKKNNINQLESIPSSSSSSYLHYEQNNSTMNIENQNKPYSANVNKNISFNENQINSNQLQLNKLQFPKFTVPLPLLVPPQEKKFVTIKSPNSGIQMQSFNEITNIRKILPSNLKQPFCTTNFSSQNNAVNKTMIETLNEIDITNYKNTKNDDDISTDHGYYYTDNDILPEPIKREDTFSETFINNSKYNDVEMYSNNNNIEENIKESIDYYDDSKLIYININIMHNRANSDNENRAVCENKDYDQHGMDNYINNMSTLQNNISNNENTEKVMDKNQLDQSFNYINNSNNDSWIKNILHGFRHMFGR
ncbi:unnamed protein product [Cunninghamella echinulata]